MLELVLTTFNKELYEQGLKEEGEILGVKRGEKQGEAKLSKLINALLDDGLADIIRLVTTDEAARDEYYKKYGIE